MAAEDAPDIEELIRCPYDDVHMIRHKRMQYHLRICRKNHPDAQMGICPFNSKHHVPKVELPYHTANCPDKGMIMQNLIHQNVSEPVPQPEERYKYECTENWENEMVSGHYFNLYATGKVDAYTRIPREPQIDQSRMPHDLNVILRLSQEKNNLARNNVARGAPLPGVGRGHISQLSKLSLCDQPPPGPSLGGGGVGVCSNAVEPQSNSGYGRGVRKPISNPSFGQQSPGPVSKPVDSSSDRSSVLSVSEAPPRKATSTSAFGLASIGVGSGTTVAKKSPMVAAGAYPVKFSVQPSSGTASVCSTYDQDLSEGSSAESDSSDRSKIKRSFEKKLREIERLENDQYNGRPLDAAQKRKIEHKSDIMEQLKYI